MICAHRKAIKRNSCEQLTCNKSSSSQAPCFPLAAPQGEERAATSKTRRRRSGSSGTRSVGFANLHAQRGVECPNCRLTTHPAHARGGPFLTRRPPWRVRAIQLSVTPLADRVELRCAFAAASGAPANSMALAAPRRRRRCSRPLRATSVYAHTGLQ